MTSGLDILDTWNNDKKIHSWAIERSIDQVKSLQQELLDFLSDPQDGISFSDLWEEYLGRIIAILSITQEVIPIPDSENTEYALEVLRECARVSMSEENQLLWVEELLDNFISTIEEKLLIKSVKLPFSIYPPNHTTVIEEWGEETEKFDDREVAQAPKFQTFLRILNKRWISFDSLIVLEEDEEVLKADKRMREIPYKIIYLREWDVEKTVLISDEVWQATFVYEWIIREDNFANFSKWEAIESIIPEKIVFWKTYNKRLEKAIFEKREKQEVESGIYLIFEKWESLNIEKEKTMYRSILLNYIEELRDAWIECMEWIWYFWDVKGSPSWPRVGDKALNSFPNQAFNRAHAIGSKVWLVRDRPWLKKMFQILWFNIATDKQENTRWANMLFGAQSELVEIGVYYIDNIWYFWDAILPRKPCIVWGRWIRSFPSNSFNQWIGIVTNRDGKIRSLTDLRKMFQALWLVVATEEQEHKRWAQMIIEHKEELGEAGIIYENEIWYFWDIRWNVFWPKINGRWAQSFPNREFYRIHGILEDTTRVASSPVALRSMFQILWLQVATEEEEKKRWMEVILSYEEELKEAGIICIDWVWYFSDSVPAVEWPKIWWRTLRSFPNLTFNKESWLWNDQWQIQSWIELSKLFGVLWLKIASREQEQQRLILKWKNLIISHKNTLEEAWVFEENSVWYFYHIRAMKFWPAIDWKKLRNFPNSNFIRETLWAEQDSIINWEQMQVIFSTLWLMIADKEQERAKIIKDAVKKLIENESSLLSIGMVHQNGTWNIENLSDDFLSLEIWGIKLRNFPNIEFNRENGIWGSDWRLTPSKKSVRGMLKWLNETVVW